MRQLLLKNIGQLVTMRTDGRPWKAGSSMSDVGLIEGGSVLIEDSVITWVGSSKSPVPRLDKNAAVIDASEKAALPGFVDCHTHLVFAGTRENEFALRAQGKSYQEIAELGGGILSTVRTTREATKKELKKLASKRLDDLIRHGTTTVEIKSGYGLEPETEIRILEVIHELSQEHFTTIVATFLGAHAIPPEYKSKPDEYVRLVCDRMMPYVAKRKLARFCDVFCEKGYFSVDQSKQILTKAVHLGFGLKLHADELAPSGGSGLAADLHAVSADHLEHVSDSSIANLRSAGVVAVLLPGVSFFLNHAYAPARKLIDAGVPVSIASDFNPGSCMSFSIPLMMTIACTHMGMTPEEALVASTINGAAALSCSDRYGSIEVGKRADIILYDIPNYRYLAYHFGVNHVSTIIKNGTVLEFR